MRRALGLLLLLSCGGSGDESAPAPAPAPAAFPKLTVAGGHFRDPDGRAVFLRGVNYSHRTKSKPYASWQKPEHFEQIRAWGFNCVRYLLMWDAIEPEPGQIDEAYLDHVEQAIGWAAANGLYVLLDMHQDLYSGIFGGDGAPAWAAVDDLVEPNELLSPWFLTYFTTEVRASFDRFWTDADLQAHYAAAWKAVSLRAKSHGNVVGYDLMNEPFPGNEWPWSFESGKLAQCYAKVAAAIREADAGAIVFVEPAAVTANQGIPTTLQPPPGPVVYAPHFYDPALMIGGPYLGGWLAQIAFGVMKAQATSMAAPLFVGEFGISSGHPAAHQAMLDQCAAMEAALASWTYWDFNPDLGTNATLEIDTMSLSADHPALPAVRRPYARAVAGEPVAMSWDGTRFRLQVRNATALPTVVYLPFEAFQVEGAGAWTWDPAAGVLSVWANSPSMDLRIIRE
jgi:endoglycosylceramidase